ncbi:hypothetical protein Pcar_3231 [Syntrophotalea carbinolica DSM 2380]|uniref:Uncharacterized protein n=1 Tax=Syntrophotalea carbinolica (strain DSM 2380 / NBRC 103641 / GraBd1) TaxID=338963 RepID=Q0C6T6_SYNC1|nr:hypothetical protein Pcar_3231 [Syntrophotalea carbinolica DSM 2380]
MESGQKVRERWIFESFLLRMFTVASGPTIGAGIVPFSMSLTPCAGCRRSSPTVDRMRVFEWIRHTTGVNLRF